MTRPDIQIHNDDNSFSGASSVVSWLEGHPSLAEGYAQPFLLASDIVHDTIHGINTQRRSKRIKGDSASYGSATKRPKLAEIHINRMDDQPETPKKFPGTSPRKARKGKVADEEEDTPRPNPLYTTNTNRSVPSIPQIVSKQRITAGQSLSNRSGSSINDDDSEEPSSPSKRSRSPTKHMFDLRLADISVQCVHISKLPQDLPAATDLLQSDLKKIGRGKGGTIPWSYHDRVMNLVRTDVPDDDDFGDPFGLFSAEEDEPAAFWVKMSELLEDAVYCQERLVPEVIWNEKVHAPILDMALRRNTNNVSFINVTTARITDKSLLPTVAAGKKIMDAKLVDYALILDYTYQDFESNIIKKCINMDTDSINQTTSPYMRLSPIAVSIETKRGLVDGDTADLQLALWVYAHFAKLKQLIPRARQHGIPYLPLVKVLGHDWYLQLARPPIGSNPLSDGKVTIFGSHPLGSTSTVLGAFQIVAAVRRIARWVSDDYCVFLSTEVVV